MRLRDDTGRVWDFLREHPALSGFILVGGTALALHIEHRTSEDLDFAFVALRLPRARIDALRRSASERQLPFSSDDPPEAIQDFEIAGMDLNDYQQNYLVDGTVKVTFFAPDDEVRRHLGPSEERGPRLATLDEIFAMKCLVCADRSKTRDWFDLYVLMREHGYDAVRFVDVFEISEVPAKAEIALGRLCSGRPNALDEGFDSLLPRPPSVKKMADFFAEVRDDVRAETARRRASRARG